jgi:beta-phosphoglucomutase
MSSRPLKEIILKKKAILWDFDGSFCDSERVHFLAYKKAFQKFNHAISEEEYYNTFTHTGGGIVQEVKNHGVDCDIETIKKDKAQFYWELISKGEAKIFKEMPQIIQVTKNMGIQNVIASNSLKEEICLILEKNLVSLEISKIFGWSADMRKKPFPDLFIKAMADLSLKPEECLVIEDSERGLVAAERAGCDAIWIQTPFNENFTSHAPYLFKMTHEEFLKEIERK